MGQMVIGIAGSQSGSGKTTVAENLLRSVSGWGAVKYTPTDFYCSVVQAPEVLEQSGKDTARFKDAGASRVLWIQSPRGEELEEAAAVALAQLSGLPGVIVEGNGAIEVLHPDIVIFIFNDKGLKPGAEKLLAMADVVLRADDDHTPEGLKEGAVLMDRDDVPGYVALIQERIDERSSKG